jgi:small subunit ribosomal protein S2
VARAAAAATAGRDEKPEPATAGAPAAIGADEPMPEWERDLLQPSSGAEAAPSA